MGLECIRLAVEFAAEIQRSDPLSKAQEYYDWVMNKNSSIYLNFLYYYLIKIRNT